MNKDRHSSQEWVNYLLSRTYTEGRRSGWYWVDFGEGWECAQWDDIEGAWLQGGMFIAEEPNAVREYIPYPEE